MFSRRSILAALGVGALPVAAAEVSATPSLTPKPVIGQIMPRIREYTMPDYRFHSHANIPMQVVREIRYDIWNGRQWVDLETSEGQRVAAILIGPGARLTS